MTPPTDRDLKTTFAAVHPTGRGMPSGLAGLFLLAAWLAIIVTSVGHAEAPATKPVSELYTEGPGTNPTWQELIDKGTVVVGSKEGKPLSGTKITVNQEALEANIGKVEGTLRPSSIHTHVKSGIPQKEFEEWSRWYQEDGNTQIFRLFKGEQSVRDVDNIKAGRIEAVRTVPVPKPGNWVQWEGTYTIIKPGGGCLLQVMVGKDKKTGEGGLWPVHIDQHSNGEIVMLRRRPKEAEERTVSIGKDLVGVGVTVKVLFDGHTTYEVFRKIHGRDNDFVFVGSGTYNENGNDNVGFRWGIYQGSKPGSKIGEDCMVFVTGISISEVKHQKNEKADDEKPEPKAKGAGDK